MQAVAPGALSVLVTDPAAQATQLVVDAVLYLPALQAVHELAPVAPSLSVTEPAPQATQLVVDAVL